MTQPQTRPTAEARENPARFRGEPCRICGDPTDERLDSSCRICGGPVHVAWAEGAPESACSQVVSPLQCCGIAFVCNACVAEGSLA